MVEMLCEVTLVGKPGGVVLLRGDSVGKLLFLAFFGLGGASFVSLGQSNCMLLFVFKLMVKNYTCNEMMIYDIHVWNMTTVVLVGKTSISPPCFSSSSRIREK